LTYILLLDGTKLELAMHVMHGSYTVTAVECVPGL